jgi:hypothetical protein
MPHRPRVLVTPLALTTALSIVTALVAPAAAQNYARVNAVEDLRLDLKALKLETTRALTVGPDGRIVVIPRWGDIVAFDSTGRRTLWKLHVGRGRNDEIAQVTRLGWIGAAMWIGDEGFEHVAVVDANGVVTRSIGQPAFVKPTWADRRKYPVFSTMDAYAVYSDNTLLVRPYNATSVMNTPEYVDSLDYFLRVSEHGSIQKEIARVPRAAFMGVTLQSGRSWRGAVPFASRPFVAVSPDGMRIATLVVGGRGADSLQFRITSVNERGDTVFRRSYPFTPVPVAQDSLKRALSRIASLAGGRANQTAAVDSALRGKVPAFFPPVNGFSIGRDRTFWVTLRSAGPDTSSVTRLMLAPNGDPVGLVSTPRRVTMAAADRHHLWGIEYVANAPVAIVRYRLAPAN